MSSLFDFSLHQQSQGNSVFQQFEEDPRSNNSFILEDENECSYDTYHRSGSREMQRIKELEEQVQNLIAKLSLLEHEKQTATSTMNQESEEQEVIQLVVNDFTPEWDYLEGGAKLIICCESTANICPEFDHIVIDFGGKKVDGKLIQANVIKCYGSYINLIN